MTKGIIMVILGVLFIGAPISSIVALLTENLRSPYIEEHLLTILIGGGLSAFLIYNGVQWINDKPTSEEE